MYHSARIHKSVVYCHVGTTVDYSCSTAADCDRESGINFCLHRHKHVVRVKAWSTGDSIDVKGLWIAALKKSEVTEGYK